MNTQAGMEVLRVGLATFPFNAGQLDSCPIGESGDHQWIGSRITNQLNLFSVNIIGDVFYLLSIEIPAEFRGASYGDRLYRLMENAASAFGCREIRQTPSGWTRTGETRQSYLVRRGWVPDGVEVVKKCGQLLNGPEGSDTSSS